jgi:hypothetical protein
MLLGYCFADRNRKRRDIITKNSEIKFFNVDGYCGVAADRRRDLGWNPSTLTFVFFFIEKVPK